MWIIILATLFTAFLSGLAMGAALERGHWEATIKGKLDRLDSRRIARTGRTDVHLLTGPDTIVPVTLEPTGRNRARPANDTGTAAAA